MHLSQKALVMLISLNRLFGHLDQMQLRARGLNHLWVSPSLALRPGSLAWCKGLR